MLKFQAADPSALIDVRACKPAARKVGRGRPTKRSANVNLIALVLER